MVEGRPLLQLEPSALVGWLHKLLVVKNRIIAAVLVMLIASGFNVIFLIVYAIGLI